MRSALGSVARGLRATLLAPRGVAVEGLVCEDGGGPLAAGLGDFGSEGDDHGREVAAADHAQKDVWFFALGLRG